MTVFSTVSKNTKTVLLILSVGLLSPFLLAKVGFWGTAHANEPITFPSTAQPIDRTQMVSYAQAVKAAAPAVVSVHTKNQVPMGDHPLLKDPFFRHFFGGAETMPTEPQNRMQPGLGSGVVVHQSGYILTNNHVIQDATEITVTTSEGNEYAATLVGADRDSDLAVLKVDTKELPVITLGDSNDLLIGDVVLAIGNPYGVGQTVTQGIVSATGRTNLGISAFENFIQTDAAISPGNSGGALINTNGHLVGINTAILTNGGGTNQGIGFATPINLAKDVMTQLIDQGQVVRGWLGVSVQSLTPELRELLNFPAGEGTVVAGVLRNGPAQKAGIIPGDVIMSLNQQPIPSPSHLIQVASALEPDVPYPLAVSRNGDIYDFTVVVGKRPTGKNSKH